MIAVVNFGGQYAHLIARRIRELGINSQLFAPEQIIQESKKLSPSAIIFSGSPNSVYEKNSPKINPKIYELKIPILGICYGQQLIAYQNGGKVKAKEKKQFGSVKLKARKVKIFEGFSNYETVWFSHGDQVESLPKGFVKIASTKTVKIAAFQNTKKNIYAIQFHPEVSHTPKGDMFLKNFLFKIAKANKDWNIKKVKDEIIEDIKNKTKNKKIIMAVSGGVDSLVAASIIKEANSKNLHLIFIDTGLMRKNEVDEIKLILKEVGFKNLHVVDASKIFMKSLKKVTGPEEKRKIIAKLYFQILEKYARKIKNVSFLGQGTIYPDRIESAQPTKHANKIKSHHNVTLPKKINLQVLEPLADFYKDEVRILGMSLGIPQEFLNRHPFPGPALAIRILGEITEEKLKILREVDSIFISELKAANLYNNIGQAFAAILPIKAVGVMDDARTYSYIVSLRSVDTRDFMTADWTKLPYEFLEKVSSRIVNEVKGVNRVVYDITQKPPSTIEYE